MMAVITYSPIDILIVITLIILSYLTAAKMCFIMATTEAEV